MTTVTELKNLSTQVRRDILRMVNDVASGHPGGSMGCTEYFVALYFEIMKHDTKFNMDGVGEDLFFLSNGHISPVFYSTLARSGYFDVAELATFRKLNTRLQGHPTTHEHLPGIRMASGSLGQGLSVALGAAQAKKMNGDKSFVYSLHGDGEFQEGQIWEALMFGAQYKLDNVIATMDYNGKQIDGDTDDVISLGNIEAKIQSFGWDTMWIEDGNDIEQVIAGLNEAKSRTGKGKPVFIIMRTQMAFGVDFMQGQGKWHGNAPSNEQLEKALAQLPETIGDY
jgi:transketolase